MLLLIEKNLVKCLPLIVNHLSSFLLTETDTLYAEVDKGIADHCKVNYFGSV